MREHGDNILISIHDDGDYRADTTTESAEGVPDIALLALIERADLAGGHLRVSRRAAGGSMMEITVPGASCFADTATALDYSNAHGAAAMEGGRDAGD
jgi:hypothetical protein